MSQTTINYLRSVWQDAFPVDDSRVIDSDDSRVVDDYLHSTGFDSVDSDYFDDMGE